MTFELCVPAYNEAAIIRESLIKLRETLEAAGLSWKIVVADNASNDGTGELVAMLNDSRIRVLRIEEKGKGAALIAAARASEEELFGFIDADLSASPADLAPLLAVVRLGEADLVIGSRLLDPRTVRRGMLRSLSSRLFNGVRRVLLGVDVTDSQCGLKVMNSKGREILASCTETGWFLDIELLARAEHAGLRIRELPVQWQEKYFAGRASKLRVLRDGIGSFFAFIRIRRSIKGPSLYGT